MAFTFGDEAAPGRRITQYFEMLGNRALYHDGWAVGCLHGRLPWLTAGAASFDDDTWELYNIEQDFSQADDLALAEPKKLRDLQDRFMAKAAKYNVLPLDDRFAQRADPRLRPSHIRGKTHFEYLPGAVRIGERSSPNTKNVHHTLAADVLIPPGGAEGVLVCCGGISGGYTLFVKDDRRLSVERHWELCSRARCPRRCGTLQHRRFHTGSVESGVRIPLAPLRETRSDLATERVSSFAANR